MNEFNLFEEERTKFNNEIVVPEYRKFCRENELKFHFWDEIPEGKNDYEIYIKESELHKESMVCFNNLKTPFVYNGKRISRYNFEDWSGGIKRETWNEDDFFNETAELKEKYKVVEDQMKKLLMILMILFIAIVFFLSAYLMKFYFGEIYKFPLFVFGIIFPAWLCNFTENKFFRDPLKDYKKRIDTYKIRLEKLKKQF